MNRSDSKMINSRLVNLFIGLPIINKPITFRQPIKSINIETLKSIMNKLTIEYNFWPIDFFLKLCQSSEPFQCFNLHTYKKKNNNVQTPCCICKREESNGYYADGDIIGRFIFINNKCMENLLFMADSVINIIGYDAFLVNYHNFFIYYTCYANTYIPMDIINVIGRYMVALLL